MAEAKPSVSEPASAELGRWESILKRFDRAWQQQCRPAIDDYLPENSAGRLAVLVELVHADLEYRLNGGEAVRVEEYLERYPELHGERAAVLELIAAERAWRRRRDPGLTSAEYLARFPQYEHELALAVECCTAVAEGRRDHQSPDLESTIRGSATPLPMDPNLPSRIGDYAIDGILGQGGMGIVLRGKDPDFHRSLAIKVLGEKLRGHPEATRRFLEEARIMGQLQHPGIPPVHALGKLPDGRPYFVMKRIKGETLAALLSEVISQRSEVRGQESDKPRDEPGESRGSAPDSRQPTADGRLPRFIAIFEQICQTLAYAHSRGVIHRDLKPHNVMVGAFGEVQVMDWGIAKIVTGQDSGIRESQPPDQTNFKRADDTPETHPGQAIGTWAYMPPEQARGEVENLDPRADVFGLGGILCEILSRAPPFNRDTPAENRSLTMQGDLSEAFARLDRCGADAELIDLAKKCLAPKRDQRPSSAEIVAQAIAFYRHQVQARLHQAEIDRAAAQVKATEEHKLRLMERQKRRIARWLAAAACFLVLAGSGAAIWYYQDQANRAADAAEQELKEERRQAAQRDRQKSAEQGICNALDQATKARGELHAQLKKPGGVFELLNKPATWEAMIRSARAEWQRARDLHAGAEGKIDAELAEQIDVLDRKLNQDDADRLLAVRLEKIREDKAVILEGRVTFAGAEGRYGKVLSEAGFEPVPGQEQTVAKRIGTSAIRDYLVAALDDWASLGGPSQGLVLATTRLANSDPIGQRLRDPGLWKDRKVLEELADKILQDQALDQLSPQTLGLLAQLLHGNGSDAEKLLRRAKALYPADFWINSALANVLHQSKNLQAAAGFYHTALAIRPRSAVSWSNLGNVLREQNDLPAAIDACHKALAIDPKIAIAWNILGTALHDQKNLTGAIDAFKKALAIDAQFALPWYNLGVLLESQKDWTAAIDAYKKALAINPNHAKTWYNLGVALREQQDLAGAIDACKKALAINPNYAKAWYNLGTILVGQQDLTGAIDAWKKALAIDPKFSSAWTNLGLALHEQNDLAGAIDAYKKALATDPRFAPTWLNLGNTLCQKKDLAGAIDAYNKALAIDPKYASAWTNLGYALHDQKDLAGAIDAFKKALDIDPKCALAWTNLGSALRDQKDMTGAIDAHNKALAIDPKCAKAWTNLGSALHDQTDLAGAIVAYKKALAIDPKLASDWNNLGVALHDQKELASAIDAYKKALAINSKYALAWNNLGYALYDQKDLAGAIDAYKKALALDPKHTLAWNNLGIALDGQKDLAGAIDAYKKALAIDAKYAQAWSNLGNALYGQKDLAGAIAAYKEALAIDAKYAQAWSNLGNALYGQKDLAGAIDAFRKALAIEPRFARAHGGLGEGLLTAGDFPQAAESLQQALDLIPPGNPLAGPIQSRLQRCRRLLALEQRLPAVLGGEKSTATEQLTLADLCQRYGQRYHTAARLYAAAFAAEPKLAEDLTNAHLYHAARAASLACAGKGKGADKLDDSEHAKLRSQALDWLGADLAACRRAHQKDPFSAATIQETLKHWQADPDLATVRDDKEFARLPKEEQIAWLQLWADVEQLRKTARLSYTETSFKGSLTPKERELSHEHRMSAGKTYVIDMTSPQFDTYLRLEDSQKKVLAENDDIDPSNNLNSRIVFTPTEDGGYHLIATSFQQRGVGAYTLIIREFQRKEK